MIVADLQNQLSKSGIIVDASFESGEEVLKYAQSHSPDVIIMDIQLYGALDGIDTAHRLNATADIPIIFLTSNTDPKTFNRAKMTFPHAFLSKPFRIKDVLHAIELSLDLTTEEAEDGSTFKGKYLSDRIFVRDREYLYKVLYADIQYIEADGAYTKIYTNDKTYTLSQTMKKVADKIQSEYLIRIHRSFIINTNNVDRISEGYIYIGENRIPVSRAHRENLNEIFNSL